MTLEPLRLRLAEVAVLSGLSPLTIRRRVKAGKFPQPVDRSKTFLFDRAEVMFHLTGKRTEDSAPPPRAKWITGSDKAA